MKILLLLLAMMSSNAFAQHVSNGGNYISTEFITRARLIHKYLSEKPDHAVNSKINLQQFQQAINKSIVEVSSESMPFDTLGREVDAYVTPYPCSQASGCKIVLRRSFWNEALKSNLNIYRLVLHEFLRVMNLQDENNEISALLDIQYDYFGRTGVIEVEDLQNLDFETPNTGFDLPFFWYISTVNLGYRLKVDESYGYKSGASLVISSDYSRQPLLVIPGAQAFASVVQCFDAKPYWGKAIHLSGYIETLNLRQGTAGLWMRVDRKDGTNRILDNMANRAVYGSTPWRRSDVILYAEENVAEKICFGALLIGVGSARFDELRVRVIGE